MLKLTVLLRHNLDLEGDLALARQELQALVGRSGSPLNDAGALRHPCPRGLLLRAAAPVGWAWEEVGAETVHRLAHRSAFAQEVLVGGPATALAELAETLRLPWTERDGHLVVVPLHWLLESECALRHEGPDRLARAGALLLEPWRGAGSAAGRRLRGLKRTSLSLTHDLHIYKAKFFPRLVRGLLNVYAPRGGRVLDPFCGSGTTLLEAALLGHPAAGVDVDPVCARIAQAKLAPFLEPAALRRDLASFLEALEGPPTDPEGFPAELGAKLARRDARLGTAEAEAIVADTARLKRAIARLGGPEAPVLCQVLASDAVTKKVRHRFVGVGNGRYTVEVVRQPLLDRLRSKVARCLQLAGVFAELQAVLGPLPQPVAGLGDAREGRTWGGTADLILTSPPYLPASSGREHYATARALSFHVLGLGAPSPPSAPPDPLPPSWPEAVRLLRFLEADRHRAADPQRDPMRAARKAGPTRSYLHDMRRFLGEARASLRPGGTLLLVVAAGHTFYTSKTGRVDHRVDGERLYAEIAASAGLQLREALRLELRKPASTHARPRARDRYHEVVLALEAP